MGKEIIESIEFDADDFLAGVVKAKIPTINGGVSFLSMSLDKIEILHIYFESDGKVAPYKIYFVREGEEIPKRKFSPKYLGAFKEQVGIVNHVYICKDYS